MFIETNLDSTLVFLVFILSVVGLVRGFLDELTSIVNWFGSFYLTSKIKPILTPLLKDKIQIPFLLDIIVNAILFVSLIIVVSIFNRFLVSKIKHFIPSSTNNGLGFLFGFAKGALLSCFILAFLSVIYDNSKKHPDWLYNSYIYNSTKDKNSLCIEIIGSILGDISNEDIEKNHKELKESIEKSKEKIENVKEIRNELESMKDDIMDNINENINNKDIEKLINIISE